MGVSESLFNKFSIGKSVTDFESSEQLPGYSKVIIEVSDEISYESGTDTGRTLTLSCPWGTQKMADDILNSVRGYQYQPYTATGAIVDPSVEIGDAIQTNGIHGGVYDTSISFGSIPRFDVSAPSDEEVDESTPYKSATDRKITRQKLEMNAQFEIQAGLISAKVSKTGGEDSSFGWELDERSWTLKSNGGTVLTVDKSGLEVKGKITATSGKIGGFDIQSDYLSYNGQTWGGTNTTGAYLGTSGLQLGKNFKVDMQGNLTAASGTFSGTVYAGKIQYGENYGTLSGSGITSGSVTGSQVAGSTLSTAKFTSGVNTSLGYADFANGVFSGWNTAANIGVGKLTVTDSMYVPAFGGTRKISVTTLTVNGNVYNFLTV